MGNWLHNRRSPVSLGRTIPALSGRDVADTGYGTCEFHVVNLDGSLLSVQGCG